MAGGVGKAAYAVGGDRPTDRHKDIQSLIIMFSTCTVLCDTLRITPILTKKEAQVGNRKLQKTKETENMLSGQNKTFEGDSLQTKFTDRSI